MPQTFCLFNSTTIILPVVEAGGNLNFNMVHDGDLPHLDCRGSTTMINRDAVNIELESTTHTLIDQPLASQAPILGNDGNFVIAS